MSKKSLSLSLFERLCARPKKAQVFQFRVALLSVPFLFWFNFLHYSGIAPAIVAYPQSTTVLYHSCTGFFRI